MLLAFKLINLNTGEVRRFWNCISSHCCPAMAGKHSRVEEKMRNMSERVKQTLLVFVEDISSLSQKCCEIKKSHCKVFRASNSVDFLAPRALASSVLFTYLKHSYL